MKKKNESKTRGGKARAEALTPERRKEIAKKAAEKRWGAKLPVSDYEGSFPLGDRDISCAVLEDGTRVITQATFLRALGRSRSPKAGTGVLSTVDRLPFFLQADALKPFLSDELMVSTSPIFYTTKSGVKAAGYDASLLPKVADVYLQWRDSYISADKKIPLRNDKMFIAADILMRSLAHVGILALVDEATGFQRDRASNALAEILEKYIAKELQPWVKTFPDEYYEQLFRLRGLEFPQHKVQRPQYFGHLTNDIIYKRLAPAVLKELDKTTPKDDKGRRKNKLFQGLTPELGHPKLREHMASVVTIMKLSKDYMDFKEKLDAIHAAYNETLPFDFDQQEGMECL